MSNTILADYSTPLAGRPTQIPIDQISVGPRLRALDEETMRVLAESMKALGLKTPITVRRTTTGYELVTGRHRLEAARVLDWQEISALIFVGDATDARKWEIAENLHRAELTVLERATNIAEWIRLVEGVSGQVVQKPQGGRPEGGISAASRELGIERKDAERAIKVASITEQAKEAARKAELDDNQSALLSVAKESAGDQAAKVAEIVKRKKRTREEVARVKAAKARRHPAKQAPQGSERNAQGEQEAAVRSMAILILELPEPSVRSFIEKAEVVPLIRISDLISAMQALRPEQFEERRDEAGDTADTERLHCST